MRADNLRKHPSHRRFQAVLVDDDGRGGCSTVVSRRLEYGQLQLTPRLPSALQDWSEMPLPHVGEKVSVYFLKPDEHGREVETL